MIPSKAKSHCCIQIPESLSPVPKKKALLIGITYRDNGTRAVGDVVFPELKGPHKDVYAMTELLSTQYGYRKEDIVILTDEPGSQILPTRKNIIAQIHRLVHQAQPDDRFFFYYAGHTDQIENKNKTEEDGFDECLVSCDQLRIQDNELARLLIQPLPKGSQLMAVFDSCHSETLLDLPHYRCNRVWVPWISKGRRRTASLRNAVVRDNAMNVTTTPTDTLRKVYPTKRSSSVRRASRRTSIVGRSSREGPRSSSVRPKPQIWVHAQELSPIEFTLCESPTAMFPCDGWCLPSSPIDGPNVVALASCEDSQEAWEDTNGASMTQVLVELLQVDPHPTYKDLMANISHAMHTKALTMHKRARSYRKRFEEYRVKSRNKNAQRDRIEMDNFQDPSLSSQKPLDLSTRLDL